MSDDSRRTRTFTWDDPAVFRRAYDELSGREFFEAQLTGRLPPSPVGVALGFQLVEVADGRMVYAMRPEEYHYNPGGVVQGGVITAILDAAMACAIQTQLAAGQFATTLEMQQHFVRPVMIKTGEVRAEGKIIHVGGTIATAEGRLTDAAGKLYAHATTTCMIIKPL
jgi:uncharacterized protein (TIGR00369 family)